MNDKFQMHRYTKQATAGGASQRYITLTNCERLKSHNKSERRMHAVRKQTANKIVRTTIRRRL